MQLIFINIPFKNNPSFPRENKANITISTVQVNKPILDVLCQLPLETPICNADSELLLKLLKGAFGTHKP